MSDRVESALSDIRYNARALEQSHHTDIADVLLELADTIEQHYRIIGDERRERVYDATNRILEHAQATNPGGQTSEPFHKVEQAVDDILSTIGVPDRVVDE